MGVRSLVWGSIAAAALLLGAPVAGAATVPTGCSGLQSAIDTASSQANHGEGEVVLLTGMCDATSFKGVKTGVTIPAASNITIEGAPGTTSGLDGKGVEKPLLHSAGFEAADTLTIRNLTFQHADVTAGVGAALQLEVSHLTLAGDTFIENTLHGFGGGAVQVFVFGVGAKPACPSSPAPAGATILNSVFRANKVIGVNQASGGALVIAQVCEHPDSILEGNVFEGNTIELSGSGEAFGGAFTFEPGGEKPTPLIQRGNVFDSNHIVSTSTKANFGGGGEWTEGGSLISVGDRFTRNTIAGTGAPYWSWGGGLGIINSSCVPTAATESTLANAVVSGNAIGGGSGALGGGGIYIGCSPVPTHPNHLSLLDSTVTQNSVPGAGIAGIEGNPGDQLRLVNSIVSGDTGGAETGGFNGTGGSLSATFSDVCAAGGSSPLPGEGNICADPRLANAGNPGSIDVSETAFSPTIDAGSNTLVPSALTTDFLGGARILSARSFMPVCAPGVATVGPALLPAVVDIGADEFGPVAVRAIAMACPKQPSTFTLPKLTVRPNGVLLLSFAGLGAGRISVTATFKLLRETVVVVKGHRKHVKRLRTFLYGRASYTGSTPKNAIVRVKPSRQALALLRRHRRLKVQLSITFTALGRAATTQHKTVTVAYRRPPSKHHR